MNSSHENCKLVVFSNKAYNAIVNETFRKDPVETGGILLGHVLSNGFWIVMEVIPPGLKAIHQIAYFEYDTEFVNYMANSVSKQYKMELDVLGLWHRHPGSMDVFSGTDDGTNTTFAQMNPYGAISGLVNIDPKFRFTLRHVAYPLDYQIVEVEVGDDLIPPQYFELKYAFGSDLSPEVPTERPSSSSTLIGEPQKQSHPESNDAGNGNDVGQQSGNSNNSPSLPNGLVTDTPQPKAKNQQQNPHRKNPFQQYMPIILAGVFLLIGILIGGGMCSKRQENPSPNPPTPVVEDKAKAEKEAEEKAEKEAKEKAEKEAEEKAEKEAKEKAEKEAKEKAEKEAEEKAEKEAEEKAEKEASDVPENNRNPNVDNN